VQSTGSRRRPWARGFLGTLVLCSWGAAQATPDDREPPRVLADTAGTFLEISAPPVASGTGSFVFHAMARTGRDGIYYSNGGAPIPVVTAGTDADFVTGESHHLMRLGSEPAMNSRGKIVFRAVLGEGEGILAREGPFGPLHFVADSGEAFRSFSDRVQVNDLGDVLFHALVDPRGHPDHEDSDAGTLEQRDLDIEEPDKIPPRARWTRRGMQAAFDEGIFLDDGDEMLVVGGTHVDFADVSARFDLNQRGAVTYRCWTADGTEHVVWDDGYATSFDLAHTGPVFEALGDPSCNDVGDVVFTAVSKGGLPVVVHGRNARVTPQVIAEGSDVISFRPGVAIDQFQSAYFVAVQDSDRETLIVRAKDGSLRPLLRTGDPVSCRGKTSWVGTIQLSSRPFFRQGILVLLVGLEPEGQAVVLVSTAKS